MNSTILPAIRREAPATCAKGPPLTSAKILAGIEEDLACALDLDRERPVALSGAMRTAVLAGGGRIRPRLCLAMFATAHQGAVADWAVATAAATAVELMHCASLVHDDLPCFDDASTRRGAPSVHRQFGEPVALLAGNALMMLAMRWLARCVPSSKLDLINLLGGATAKTIAGQAMESEPVAETLQYHRHKTGALFEFAVLAGTRAAGSSPSDEPRYRMLATTLGDIYQLADDLADIRSFLPRGPHERVAVYAKPKGQDIAHARPNLALELGTTQAQARLESLMTELTVLHPGKKDSFVWRHFIDNLYQQLQPILLSSSNARAGGRLSHLPHNAHLLQHPQHQISQI